MSNTSDNDTKIEIESYIEQVSNDAKLNLYNTILSKNNKKTTSYIFKNAHEYTLRKIQEYYFSNETFSVVTSKLPFEFNALNNFIHVALFTPFFQSLGDTIGYYNGNWEFNYGDKNVGAEYVNELIYEFISLGGVNDLDIQNWRASDDTILYLATYEILTEMSNILNKNTGSDTPRNYNTEIDINGFGKRLREIYLKNKNSISSRHPGYTTMSSLDTQENIKWDKLKYNSKAIGNGSAMRSGCIGMFYPGSHNRSNLVKLAVECSRITHNSALAILGSVTSALFTAYALEKMPVNLWPNSMLVQLRNGIIDSYMKENHSSDFQLYSEEKIIYLSKWDNYLTLFFSGINPKFDLRYMKNPVLRYKKLVEQFSIGCDIPGSCADDCIIMAYDSVLRSQGNLEKLIVNSILHPGDSDTVGSIAFSWFGAYYYKPNMEYIVEKKFNQLEFYSQLEDLYEKNIMNMIKIYYYDIYLEIAYKYLNSLS